MDCSLPDFFVHGISQAIMLEWVAISFSRASSRPRDWTHVSCIGRWILYHWATREAHLCVCVCVCVLVPPSCPTLCDPMDCSLPVSSVHGILQARILEWVAILFSRVSSQPRDRPRVSWIEGRFFTSEPLGKPRTATQKGDSSLASRAFNPSLCLCWALGHSPSRKELKELGVSQLSWTGWIFFGSPPLLPPQAPSLSRHLSLPAQQDQGSCKPNPYIKRELEKYLEQKLLTVHPCSVLPLILNQEMALNSCSKHRNRVVNTETKSNL